MEEGIKLPVEKKKKTVIALYTGPKVEQYSFYILFLLNQI